MKKSARGFTLIELMVSMVIGILVTGAATGMLLSFLNTNRDELKAIRLNQELRSAMTMIVKDIRRAGHARSAATMIGAANPYDQLSLTGTSQINFAYDELDNTNVETFGYQHYNSGGTQSIRTCKSATNACTNWENITDPALVTISSLTFTRNIKTLNGIDVTTISISITGALKKDAAFTRTIQETVNLRNT